VTDGHIVRWTSTSAVNRLLLYAGCHSAHSLAHMHADKQTHTELQRRRERESAGQSGTAIKHAGVVVVSLSGSVDIVNCGTTQGRSDGGIYKYFEFLIYCCVPSSNYANQKTCSMCPCFSATFCKSRDCCIKYVLTTLCIILDTVGLGLLTIDNVHHSCNFICV